MYKTFHKKKLQDTKDNNKNKDKDDDNKENSDDLNNNNKDIIIPIKPPNNKKEIDILFPRYIDLIKQYGERKRNKKQDTGINTIKVTIKSMDPKSITKKK